jgi:hypothetical protein
MKKITKPDVENTEKSYWELVLESWGLGERQLGLKEVPNANAEETDGERDQ